MRAARTRHAARDLCAQLLTTSASAPAAAPAVVPADADGQEGDASEQTPESERICAYLFRLDLTDDERE